MASSTADAQISHFSALQRVASGYGNLSLPVLVEARQRIRELLAGGETIQNKAELQRLLATVDEQLTEILTQYPEQLTENLRELVALESEFQVDNLNTVIANTSAITPESVFATAMSTPVQTGIAGDGVDLAPFIDSWSKAQVDRVSGVLRMGFFQGQTLNEISDNIRAAEGALGDMSERSARAVARTSVNHMANAAAQASYHANPDVIGYEWISVLDSRTTAVCFTGTTVVNPLFQPEKLFRSEYSGDILTFRLSTGEQFDATPNHPILTLGGWSRANEINPANDVCLVPIVQRGSVVINNDVCVPTEFSKLYDTICKTSVVPVEVVSTSATDFYGDGVCLNGDVTILQADSDLCANVEACGFEFIKNDLLGVIQAACGLTSNDGLGSLLSAGCPTVQTPKLATGIAEDAIEPFFVPVELLHNVAGPAASVEHRNSLFRITSALAVAARSGDVNQKPAPLEVAGYSGCGCVIAPCDAGGAFAIPVSIADIMSVSVEFKACHVYTLQNSQGYYTAGGAIVKNCRARDGNKYYYADDKPNEVPPAHFQCRSSTAALFTDDLQAENEAAGSTEGTEDYYPWLKGQPASVQDDALGPVRAEIFRSAGLSTSEFRAAVTDRFDQPLTLEEMAAKNTKIDDFLDD